MPTTTYKSLALPTQGVTTTWGTALNDYPFTDIDACLGGITTKSLSNADVSLSAGESKTAILRLIGTLTANVKVTTICQGFTLVENLTSGSYSVTFTNSATYGGGAIGTPVDIPQSGRYVVISDVTNGSRVMSAATSEARSDVGQVAMFAGTTVPFGWLKANGSVVLRSSYSDLWAYAQASGNIKDDATWFGGFYGAFSTGDGATTFRLPDLRGFFPRGWADDNPGWPDSGRAAGSFQDQSNLAHTHTGTTSSGGSHSHLLNAVCINGLGGWGFGASGGVGIVNRYTETDGSHNHTFTSNSSGGTQNVPQNIAMMYCIAYM